MDSHSAETMQETESPNSILIRCISPLSYFEELIHIWWQWEEHVLNHILLNDARHSVFVLNIQTQNKNYLQYVHSRYLHSGETHACDVVVR